MVLTTSSSVPYYYSFLYGTLILVGGVVGYAKAGSIPSLVAGVCFGVLVNGLTYAKLYSANTPTPKVTATGLQSLLCVSFVLAAFFGYRYATTKKFMPAGLMLFFSAFSVLFYLYFYELVRAQSVEFSKGAGTAKAL